MTVETFKTFKNVILFENVIEIIRHLNNVYYLNSTKVVKVNPIA